MTQVAAIVRDGTRLIPGAREAGRLTRFAPSTADVRVMGGASTMDAAGILARQREGGGAPNQRQPARAPFTWRHPIRWVMNL